MVISIVQFQYFFLALTRVLAMVTQVPVLGGVQIPNQVKLGLGVTLTIVMLPGQDFSSEMATMQGIAFGFAVGRELVIGLLAGFVAGLTFFAMQIFARFIGLGSGFGAAYFFNPAVGSSLSALDNFIIMVTSFLFFAVNGHHYFLLGLQHTFEVLPLNSSLPSLSLDVVLRIVGDLISVGIYLAFPVVGTLLLIDLLLGVLARIVPRVHVFFLGIPLKLGVGMIIVAFSLSFVFPKITDIFRSIPEEMMEFIGA